MKQTLGVIGLGYVGLPLAVAFSKKMNTIGFDISKERVKELLGFNDSTNEISEDELKSVIGNKLRICDEIQYLKSCSYYIITVPTPIKKDKSPDLNPLISASNLVGKIIKKGDIVIYESTVYPGLTEEICVPILEKVSKLKYNHDFYIGYSPERINPGDKEHTFTKIKKVVSGSNEKTLKTISKLYSSVIESGIFQASSIKVAEAAKVIENTQRDINIAFINELSMIFNQMDINIHEVLEAAGTKWNFLNFKPGLVGGHCIGVDPYYLAQRAKEFGYNPEMILAGRRINDSMADHVFNLVIKKSIKLSLNLKQAKFLIYGLTFKEDCPDFRNSQSEKIFKLFLEHNLDVKVYDPYLHSENSIYTSNYIYKDENIKFDVVLILVGHKEIKNFQLKTRLNPNGFVFDLKNITEQIDNIKKITL
jgi:UDP-N-acetyl-D-galactosamine dehydrogenase